jgi:predicted DNA-binding WGR domain protein
MDRFDTMHLAPTLFGGWDLVREWGRIGSPGTLRSDPFETLEESERALRRIEKQKRKRGYLSRYGRNVSTPRMICTEIPRLIAAEIEDGLPLTRELVSRRRPCIRKHIRRCGRYVPSAYSD